MNTTDTAARETEPATWISVDDRLPKYPSTVLVAYESDADGEPCLDTGEAILHPDGKWYGIGVFYALGQEPRYEPRMTEKKVRYWQPLPKYATTPQTEGATYPEPVSQNVIDHCWKMYREGQIAVEAKESFGETLQSFAKWLLNQGDAHHEPSWQEGYKEGYDDSETVASNGKADGATVPPEVMAALDRMCTPLDASVLSGATASADAHSMQVIRDYVLATARSDAPTDELREDLQEAREILENMVRSIELDGNYSTEATCTFLRQALMCLPTELAATHAPAMAEPEPGTTEYGSWVNKARNETDMKLSFHRDPFKYLCQFQQELKKLAAASGGEQG